MNKTDYVKWVNLFQEEIKNPRSVEILQEIDVGYNSKVHQISVDGRQYAVKIYKERFNGTKVCEIEKNNIIKARQTIPEAVPKVIFCSKHVENMFQREILVMENERGARLNKDVFNEKALEELINVLKRLHKPRILNRKEFNERMRIDTCRETIIKFLKEDEIIMQERASKHLDMLSAYCVEKKIFDFPKTVIHGDLWWDNILVDNGKIMIVDWLESSEQDYCQDLAQLRIGTLTEIFDASKSESLFKKIVNSYQKEFEDETIYDRIRYYVPLLYLEEAFYLPFKFFPWEIKYKENAEDFKKRFIDYFEKSESYLRHGI